MTGPADALPTRPRRRWIQYKYRIAHPILRFLPSKLAEFIGENYAKTLGIPPKRDRLKWNVEELNAILMNNLVMPRHGKGHLQTFGRIQWECDLFNGRVQEDLQPDVILSTWMSIVSKEKIHRCSMHAISHVISDVISYMISRK